MRIIPLDPARAIHLTQLNHRKLVTRGKACCSIGRTVGEHDQEDDRAQRPVEPESEDDQCDNDIHDCGDHVK